MNSPLNHSQIAKQMSINAKTIMDEISSHVDKELDRFSCGIQYLKEEMSAHIDREQERFANQLQEIRKRDINGSFE